MKQIFTNSAKTTLASAITATSGTLTVANGSVFPVIGNGQFLAVTLESGGVYEIIYVLNVAGNSLGVMRGMEGTVAQPFSVGAVVEARITKSSLERFSNTFVRTGSIDTVTSPINSYNEGFITSSLDPANNPIIIYKNSDAKWSFLNYTLIGTGVVTTSTNTTITTDIAPLVEAGAIAGRYLIQFTTGANMGNIRAVGSVNLTTNVVTLTTPLATLPNIGTGVEIFEAHSVRFNTQNKELIQQYSGRTRTLTPVGGAVVREWADVSTGTVASTTGAIETGITYNCNIDAAGNWLGRDIADVCWLEKWSDAGGVKEYWYAATAAAGVVPTWTKIWGIDTVNGLQQGPASLMNHGQCRLVMSGANLVLQPFNGNKIIINGQIQSIPAAGVTITPASLPARAATYTMTTLAATAGVYTLTTSVAHPYVVGDTIWVNALTVPAGCTTFGFSATVLTVPSTTQLTFQTGTLTFASGAATGNISAILYHYAYMNAGVMAIESVPVGHVTDTPTGVEVKAGDSTRTLIGMSFGASFPDTGNYRGFRSWFNRTPLRVYGYLPSLVSTASTAVVELSTSGRAYFLAWAGETATLSVTFFGYNSLASAALYCHGYGNGPLIISVVLNAPNINYQCGGSTGFAPVEIQEGFNMARILGQVSSGTGSFNVGTGITVTGS